MYMVCSGKVKYTVNFKDAREETRSIREMLREVLERAATEKIPMPELQAIMDDVARGDDGQLPLQPGQALLQLQMLIIFRRLRRKRVRMDCAKHVFRD